jgi:RimJ/RimL family protein N-acetyltransferase
MRLLEWDSAFFGFPIAQAEAATPDEVASIDEWAHQESVRCLYLLVSMNELRTIQAAERCGFFLTAVRTTCRSLAPFDLSESKRAPVPIRTACPSDLAALKKIASQAHDQTRFYNDPHFSRAACDRLYETWIERSSEGWAAQVLVAENDGTISGYITLHRSGNDCGSIGLFAVAESARGTGVGRQLISAALRWFDDAGVRDVSVATQAHNVAALRAYQRGGFTVSAMDAWLHKWFP